MFADSSINQSTPIFSACLTGKKILLDVNHHQAWQTFREFIPISDEDFEHYYTAVLITFAEYVQTLPASQHVFYATPGGFFQLGLDRAMIATKLALQAYQDFEGRTPDQLTVQDLTELFAVFSAALLSDLGLLMLRFQIKINDHSGVINDYNPYFGSMLNQGQSFTFQFRPNELVDWPAPASLVLARQIMSQSQANYQESGFAWISRYHDVLQLWYAMLLDLTPAQETSTRRRFLLSLIPTVDNDLIHHFLIHLHNSGALFPGKKNPSLFNIQNQDTAHTFGEDQSPQATEEFDLEKLQQKAEYDKLFGGAAADASNALPGSVAADMPPLLRYGLAFLGWLLIMARTGQLYAGSEGPAGYGLADGKVAFDVKQLQKMFAKEANFPNMSAEDLFTALQKIQVLQTQKISLSQLAWKDDLATQFTALILPVQFVFGNLAGPKIALGLGEVADKIAATEDKKPSLFGRQNRSRLIFGV